ncbi:type II toxin-antitoxin system RelE/ParE family toxin [Leptolyngbya sp. 15MV]|nr:type II toxin-antitoxin system RelE/ParE family toxin [Leptolyngbya sp. 15MV]
MKRLELSVAADADLFDILAYGTAVHGEVASDAYYDGLLEAFAFLCGQPHAAPVDEDSGLGLRRWRYRQHRIFYRVDDDVLLIVRIFHVAADAVRWLKD